MSSTYEGIEEVVEEITLPSDGDGPHIKAADVNPALEANKNAANLFNAQFLRLRAANWPYGGDVNVDCQMAAFSDKEEAWYIIGLTSVKEIARHYGNGGSPPSYALSGAVSSSDLLAIAINPAGDVVVIGKSRHVYKNAFVSYGAGFVITDTATALAVAPSGGDICFEATAGKFIAVYRDGVLGMHAETSPDGITFTPHAPPATWTGYTGTNDPVVAAIAGRTIAAFVDGGAVKVNIIRSTDGGSTWSANVQFTPAFTPTIISKPVYNSYWDEWYILLGATNHTQVIMSDDGGATWSSVYTNTLTGHDIACDGQQLVLITADGRIAHSIDHGATFQLLTRYVYVTPASRFRIFSGGGGFLATNDAEGNSRSTVRWGTGVSL